MSVSSTWNKELAPAIHEAGHAVEAHLSGMRIERVEVQPDGSGGMVPSPVGSEQLTGMDALMREIHIALAGTIAETHYCEIVGYPRELRYRPETGRTHDLNRASRVAMVACHNDKISAQRLIDDSHARVHESTQRFWEVISELGSAIVAFGVVSDPLLTEIPTKTSYL